MRTKLAAALALAAASLALACVKPNFQMSAADQHRARREAAGQLRYLRVALNAGPLWGDVQKVFLTELPGDEVNLVESPLGKPIPPPAFERVLPPGTPVRLQEIEFPGTFVVAQRVLVTPRMFPWAYLQVEGDPRTYVIVLPQELKSLEEVRAELERYLAQEDLRPAFASFPYETREAILKKQAAVGMSSRALEMAWGVPERKRVDRPAGTEEWIWASGKRRAYLRDDVVEDVVR